MTKKNELEIEQVLANFEWQNETQNPIWKGKKLSTWKNNRGYTYVTIYDQGAKRNFRLHRLIGLKYIPNEDIIKPEFTTTSTTKKKGIYQIVRVCGGQTLYEGDLAGGIEFLDGNEGYFETLIDMTAQYNQKASLINHYNFDYFIYYN